MSKKFLHSLWGNFEAFKSLNCLFMDGASYSRTDSNEGVVIQTFLSRLLFEWVEFVVIVYGCRGC